MKDREINKIKSSISFLRKFEDIIHKLREFFVLLSIRGRRFFRHKGTKSLRFTKLLPIKNYSGLEDNRFDFSATHISNVS